MSLNALKFLDGLPWLEREKWSLSLRLERPGLIWSLVYIFSLIVVCLPLLPVLQRNHTSFYLKILKKKKKKLLSPENTPPLLCFLLLNYYSIFKLIFRYHFLWNSGIWTPELKIPCYIHPQTCTQRYDYVFICIFVWIMLIFPAKK